MIQYHNQLLWHRYRFVYAHTNRYEMVPLAGHNIRCYLFYFQILLIYIHNHSQFTNAELMVTGA